jgi:hypothetical protein
MACVIAPSAALDFDQPLQVLLLGPEPMLRSHIESNPNVPSSVWETSGFPQSAWAFRFRRNPPSRLGSRS